MQEIILTPEQSLKLLEEASNAWTAQRDRLFKRAIVLDPTEVWEAVGTDAATLAYGEEDAKERLAKILKLEHPPEVRRFVKKPRGA